MPFFNFNCIELLELMINFLFFWPEISFTFELSNKFEFGDELIIIEYGETIWQNWLSICDGADAGETIRENMSSEEEGPDRGYSIFTEGVLSRLSPYIFDD